MELPAICSRGAFRIVCAPSSSAGGLRTDLREAGFESYFLDSTVIVDKHSFLAELQCKCRLDMLPGSKLTSWDAASDLLWQQLMAQSSIKAVIVWENAQVMLEGRLQLLLNCLELLLSVAELTERQDQSADLHPVMLRIVLLGIREE